MPLEALQWGAHPILWSPWVRIPAAQPAGLAEWSGCGLPSRLRGFNSRSPLHFVA